MGRAERACPSLWRRRHPGRTNRVRVARPDDKPACARRRRHEAPKAPDRGYGIRSGSGRAVRVRAALPQETANSSGTRALSAKRLPLSGALCPGFAGHETNRVLISLGAGNIQRTYGACGGGKRWRTLQGRRAGGCHQERASTTERHLPRQFHDAEPEFPGGADDRKKLVHLNGLRYETVRVQTVTLHNVPLSL